MSSFPNRPTLQQIRDRILADIDFRLPGASSRPRKSVLGVLATVLAGAFHTLYGFADWLLKQLNPLTADETWLIIWAKMLGVPRKSAIKATGFVIFGGAGTIPAGTLLRNAETYYEYQTTTYGVEGEILSVEAVTAGSPLNTDADLQLVTPIEGIELFVDNQGITGGADEESLEAWAIRIDQKLKDRKLIGDDEDYKAWALAAHPDIVDAWVYQNTPAAGEITIRVKVRDANPFPTADVLNTAQAAIDTLRNSGATVYLFPPKEHALSIRLVGIPTDKQEAVLQAIAALISTKQIPGTTLYPEEIERAVSTISTGFTLLAPIQPIVLADESLFVLEALQWQ